ncbi:MAG: response regulator [Verrucomicrobiota bacterium]
MKTLYLVEDNQDNADLVRDLLADRYTLVHFPDSQALLKAMQNPNSPAPDLLLLDISLPGMDGIALLHAIRAGTPWHKVTAIALTAHAMKQDQGRLLATGFDGYVGKPIMDDSILLAAIQKLLPTS